MLGRQQHEVKNNEELLNIFKETLGQMHVFYCVGHLLSSEEFKFASTEFLNSSISNMDANSLGGKTVVEHLVKDIKQMRGLCCVGHLRS